MCFVDVIMMKYMYFTLAFVFVYDESMYIVVSHLCAVIVRNLLTDLP